MEQPIIEPINKSKYIKTFCEKHKEKIHEKVICELCGGSYTYFNKPHHNASRKHKFKLMENEIKSLKNL